jgi:AcrR family transcriptional regulator
MYANKKEAQGQRTRAKLIAAGRKLFAARGFAETSTEEIVAAAGVTRGALYHQFADKTALFAAVFEAVAEDVQASVERVADIAGGAVEALKAGSIAFVEAATHRAVRRIYLIDAPSVLGWAAWRALDAELSMASLRQGIDAALTETVTSGADAEGLTQFLSGALNELALWVAEDETVRPRVHALIGQTIDALFPRPADRRPASL